MDNTPMMVAVVVLATTLSAGGPADARGPVEYDRASGRVTVSNGRIELVIDTKPGLNPCSLRDTKSGYVYADAGYAWSAGKAPALARKPEVTKSSAKFAATEGALTIEQTFTAPAREPGVIIERITIRNTGATTLDTSGFACGFGKKIEDRDSSRFCNIPYRVQTYTAELCDYTLPDLLTKKSTYSTRRWGEDRESPIWGAEAWAWYRDGNALLVSKYNNDSMEWSLLAPVKGEDGKARLLRFGGAGRWKLGDPEGAASLPPGGSFTFGETRYQAMDGDWKQAFSEFRRYTQSKGHRLPRGYNPPVHWNELYDNELWWGPTPYPKPDGSDTAQNRVKHYSRANMAVEAEKAREIGCECLYLDPGWDTTFGSNIWGEDRLGKQRDFVKWIKGTYGLDYLALHTPLAPWTDASTYPAEALALDGKGKRPGWLCCASSQYCETKIARLKKLCRDGAYFLMYDGSWFEECWARDHGHSVPLKRQEHVDAILRIAQEVHKDYPNVLIEQHDPMLGPGVPRYAQTHFMHSKPGASDELWGYEFMIETLGDITSRKAISLYYVNLAYTIPIYLHIDLRKDNANALGFWWFASTCRHLGVGGKSTDPAVWEAQKTAMKVYLARKLFFTQGVFYGLDETVHVHTLPDRRECVIDVFNLTTDSQKRKIEFGLADVGLPAGQVKAEGATCALSGKKVTLEIDVPAMSHRLVDLRVAGGM